MPNFSSLARLEVGEKFVLGGVVVEHVTTVAAVIVETHVLYHCAAIVCQFSILECYMSCHICVTVSELLKF